MSPAPAGTSPADDKTSKPADELGLPVSVDKIRERLSKPTGEPLRGLGEQAHFHVEIQEKQRFKALVESLDFDAGPPIPGGWYAYDQQRRLFPPTDRPNMQPYGEFTQGELVQVLITSFLQRYFTGRAVDALQEAGRTGAEEAARAEVSRRIAEYCAAQPNGGAGVWICRP